MIGCGGDVKVWQKHLPSSRYVTDFDVGLCALFRFARVSSAASCSACYRHGALVVELATPTSQLTDVQGSDPNNDTFMLSADRKSHENASMPNPTKKVGDIWVC